MSLFYSFPLTQRKRQQIAVSVYQSTQFVVVPLSLSLYFAMSRQLMNEFFSTPHSLSSAYSIHTYIADANEEINFTREILNSVMISIKFRILTSWTVVSEKSVVCIK
jgi:hypothetical protein